ncbi:inactive leucine-rich repeat receptor-like serine/threonine-protein kinase [Tanacetum coccineum]
MVGMIHLGNIGHSEDTSCSEDTHGGEDMYGLEDIHCSEGTSCSEDTHCSEGTSCSEDTHRSEDTHCSEDTHRSEDIHCSKDTHCFPWALTSHDAYSYRLHPEYERLVMGECLELLGLPSWRLNERSMISLANERVSVEAPRSCACAASLALFPKAWVPRRLGLRLRWTSLCIGIFPYGSPVGFTLMNTLKCYVYNIRG